MNLRSARMRSGNNADTRYARSIRDHVQQNLPGFTFHRLGQWTETTEEMGNVIAPYDPQGARDRLRARKIDPNRYRSFADNTVRHESSGRELHIECKFIWEDRENVQVSGSEIALHKEQVREGDSIAYLVGIRGEDKMLWAPMHALWNGQRRTDGSLLIALNNLLVEFRECATLRTFLDEIPGIMGLRKEGSLWVPTS